MMADDAAAVDRRGAALAGVVLLLAIGPARALAAAADDSVARLLSQAAIRPVDPPSSALSFELPVLGADGARTGATQSLASYHGDWLLLTFFATWCAPCRSELPTLVDLQDAVGERGFSFVTVSIDSDVAALGRYLEEGGLDLAVLWDERGRAARQYLAQSIPLSYLIDPQGRIVGVSRGARDWAALEGLFGELLRLRPPDPDLPSAYAEGDGPVSLPLRITPPTASVQLAEGQPLVNEPFSVEVEIHWAGNFDEYLLHPPQLTLPEGIEQLGVSAETGGEKGRSVVTYLISLAASQPGRYALDPLELRYTPRFESSPVASRLDGPTVEVRRRTVAGLAPLAFTGVAGGLTLALVAGSVLLRARRRSRSAGGEDLPHERWQQNLGEARRQRLEGELAACFEGLARLELELLGGDEGAAAQRAELEGRIERIRFGGEQPSSQEAQLLLRRVERQVAERTPADGDQPRSRIRLRESADGGGESLERHPVPPSITRDEASAHDRSS